MASPRVEMIFEIGFNYCCRNFFSTPGGHASISAENLNIKFSANLLNEVTSITENCTLEFFGDWARVLSFIEPDMDMQIVGEIPSCCTPAWNDCVVIKNLACPEPVETRYLISGIVVVETPQDSQEKSCRYIQFDKDRKITECKLVGAKSSHSSPSTIIPNYWMGHKRRLVDKTPNSFRPLTTITSDVAVINVVAAFIANSAPGPYKFSHPSAPYVRTHVQVCDLSYRNLRLGAIRTGGDDSRDVPSFHLHLEIDDDVSTTALPWLCVGDVLEVYTVKPVFAHKQTWNLLHKQKKFGDTKIYVHSILDGSVKDLRGTRLVMPEKSPKREIQTLQEWMRERLLKDSLVGSSLRGILSGRDLWFSGRDLVARVEKINRFTNSIFITDFSTPEDVEVLVRSSQQNFTDALNYIFTKLENHKNAFVLFRNLRINSNDNNSLYCSVEHVTRVPDFCFDVQHLIKRQNETPKNEENKSPLKTGNQKSLSFSQMIPSQWKENLKLNGSPNMDDLTQTGCVDANSQVQFEFVDDDEPCATSTPLKSEFKKSRYD